MNQQVTIDHDLDFDLGLDLDLDLSGGFLLAPCAMLPNVPLWEPQSPYIRKRWDEMRPNFDDTLMSDIIDLCRHPESGLETLCIYFDYGAMVVFMKSETQ